MNNKLSASVFMLLTVVGIVMSVIFYFQLEHERDHLEDQTIELEKQKTKMVELDSIYKVELKKCQDMGAISKVEVDALQEKSENVAYLVGLNSVGSSQAANHKKILKYLRDKGYFISFEKSNGPKITSNPVATILYYNKATKPKAESLAKELERLIGKHFELLQGSSKKGPKAIIVQNI